MARTLKVAVQMDPIEFDQHRRRLHLRPDAGGKAPRPCPVALRGAAHGAARGRQTPGRAPRGTPAGTRHPRHRRTQTRRPLHVRRVIPDRPRHHGRGADAPGSAVRHGLHHRHPSARAHPSEDAGGERPRRGSQRAGEAAGDALPRSDAADHDYLGSGGDPFVPPRIQGHHRQAAIRQRRRRRVPHQAGRREPRGAAGDALRALARAVDVPALRTARCGRATSASSWSTASRSAW